MEKYSRIAAREAGISGVGVTSANAPGTIPPGSFQELEIRTARLYGTGMGALNIGGGALMLASIDTERSRNHHSGKNNQWKRERCRWGIGNLRRLDIGRGSSGSRSSSIRRRNNRCRSDHHVSDLQAQRCYGL